MSWSRSSVWTSSRSLRLALIVRGADTGQLDLTPQSAGLLATCLGYSRMYRDDLAQLDAAMPQFDALYRWSDATPSTNVTADASSNLPIPLIHPDT